MDLHLLVHVFHPLQDPLMSLPFYPSRTCFCFDFFSGIGMIIGLFLYWYQRDRLAHVGAPPVEGPRPWGRLFSVLLGSAALIGTMKASDTYPSIVAFILGLQIAGVLYLAFQPGNDAGETVTRQRFAAILVLFISAELFWAIFDQSGSSLTLFADSFTKNAIFGSDFPSSWWQSVNSIFVIILAPIFAWLWPFLGARQPSSPVKFALGLFFVAISFLVMIPAAQNTVSGAVSPLWLLTLYFLQTIGEMCLSPVGLSTMTKLAPTHLTGLVMGIWFLAASLGSKIAGAAASEFVSGDADALAAYFGMQALYIGIAACILFALSRWVTTLMGSVR
jgi:POT family proton-dependent oligopeptide transporter